MTMKVEFRQLGIDFLLAKQRNELLLPLFMTMKLESKQLENDILFLKQRNELSYQLLYWYISGLGSPSGWAKVISFMGNKFSVYECQKESYPGKYSKLWLLTLVWPLRKKKGISTSPMITHLWWSDLGGCGSSTPTVQPHPWLRICDDQTLEDVNPEHLWLKLVLSWNLVIFYFKEHVCSGLLAVLAYYQDQLLRYDSSFSFFLAEGMLAVDRLPLYIYKFHTNETQSFSLQRIEKEPLQCTYCNTTYILLS